MSGLRMEAQPTGLTAVTGDVSPKKRLEDLRGKEAEGWNGGALNLSILW